MRGRIFAGEIAEEAVRSSHSLETRETRTDLTAPRRHRGGLSVLRFARVRRQSSIAAWPEAAFDDEILRRRMLLRDVVVINAPPMIKHVLLDNAENYERSPTMRRLLGPLLGSGLLTSDGPSWRVHRRLIAPVFQQRRIVDFVPVFSEVTGEFLQTWQTIPAGTTLDVAGAMMKLTLAIITRAMFSVDVDSRISDITEALSAYQTSMRPHLFDMIGLPPWIPRLDFDRAAEKVAQTRRLLDEAIDSMIQRRVEKNVADGDLLDLLLRARLDETGAGLGPQEIRDEVATILLAGHETTANALSWAWYLLAHHPKEESKLHREVDQVLGSRLPTVADLPRLARTRMIIEEAMRLYPPVHTLSRVAIREDEVCGHKIPRGATILIVPWLVHRHRRLWSDPERFDPDRFGPEASASRSRFAFIPFGGGPRICIGAQFAMAEAVVVLAAIAQRYRLRLLDGFRVAPVGLITLRPENGLRMRLEPRQRSSVTTEGAAEAV